MIECSAFLADLDGRELPGTRQRAVLDCDGGLVTMVPLTFQADCYPKEARIHFQDAEGRDLLWLDCGIAGGVHIVELPAGSLTTPLP